ncbi:hypothetical protein ACM26E_25090 [Kluyvera cryocrescens]|uniref:hypothetical protein n=1 Tax=Kluyvera cryocrescens TaxID=580 RepID=UPI000D8C217A|nr:hypothetical protein [Kluyvera cryocrescens]MEB6633992.1 hypothetical protein [Kluyvera cryocrescens]MEB7556210.1 hypothetical protein [Kluyvera cryocrescens]MEB7713851.1 hypothetical protein [Kluyvera cryocrescens]WNN72561.1 hypothetical protein RIN60_04125 [Kluyvera cryocrescens]SQC34873.1 Uncharacterised protein [Kluyvera cryocrescens]
MQQKLLTGHVDQRLWNGIILKEGESKQFIELPAAVLPHVEPGQSLRLLFRRQQLVRIFNVSTNQLYEADFFANKPLRRKYQILLFLLVAVICGIPAIGALFGLALIGGLIGTTFRRSEAGALQVALVSTVTALLYVGMGGYLLMTGQFLLAFVTCTILVFGAFIFARTIGAKEARILDKMIVGETTGLS